MQILTSSNPEHYVARQDDPAHRVSGITVALFGLGMIAVGMGVWPGVGADSMASRVTGAVLLLGGLALATATRILRVDVRAGRAQRVLQLCGVTLRRELPLAQALVVRVSRVARRAMTPLSIVELVRRDGSVFELARTTDQLAARNVAEDLAELIGLPLIDRVPHPVLTGVRRR